MSAMGSTLTSTVWVRSVMDPSTKEWKDDMAADAIVLPQGTWLVVWSLANLYQGNWMTPPPIGEPPPWRTLYFAPPNPHDPSLEGIYVDPGSLPEGVTIRESPEAPVQENITQWTMVFEVHTSAPASFPYFIRLVAPEENRLVAAFVRRDPTILVETDPVSP